MKKRVVVVDFQQQPETPEAIPRGKVTQLERPKRKSRVAVASFPVQAPPEAPKQAVG